MTGDERWLGILRERAAAGGPLDPGRLLRDEQHLSPSLKRKAVRLREVVAGAGRERVVLGLSGGIDSAVALAIAARSLGPERVVAVRLPSRHTEQVHMDDAAAAAAAAGLPDANLRTLSIEPMLAGVATVREGIGGSQMRLGNASARCRMIAVYDLAAECGGLVIGTENRSEMLLGYFTRFGDAASDIEPISDLYKTEVRAAARVLELPEALIAKHPTAGLWGGQTDEDELGFSYRDGDVAMVAMCDLQMGVEETAERTGVAADVVGRVAARLDAAAWKQHVPHVL